MKFTLHSTLLAESIAAATSSLPSRTTTAVLMGVLVEAQIGAVTLSSFNYDRSTTRVVGADVDDTDTVVVAGKLLGVVGAQLPKNDECVVTANDSEMTITAGRTEFKLPLLHAPDFPKLPEIPAGAVIGTVECEAFADAIRTIGAFASSDPLPADLTALNIDCTADQLVLRATDRYVAGLRRIPWDGVGEVNINVPAVDLTATVKAVAGTGADPIELLWDGGMLGLRTRSTHVTTRVLAEEFPAGFDRATQAETYFATTTVATADLIGLVRRAATLADDQWAQIEIAVSSDGLSAATTQSMSGRIVDGLDADHCGGERSVTVSGRRLNTALGAIDDPQITLAFQEKGHLLALHPGPITPDPDGVLRAPDRDTVAAVMGIRTVGSRA